MAGDRASLLENLKTVGPMAYVLPMGSGGNAIAWLEVLGTIEVFQKLKNFYI